MPRIAVVFLGFMLLLGAVATSRAQNADVSRQVVKPVREAVDIRQSTQKEEEKWRDERRQLVAVYDQLQQERKRLQDRKEDLQNDIIAARDRIVSKQKQLEDIEQISTRIKPFLQKLAGRLRQLVSGGAPFLATEREQRIARLTGFMEDPDVSASETFRKAMEALLVEAEYGSTIEVYQHAIELHNAPTLVNVFRLGRISLFY